MKNKDNFKIYVVFENNAPAVLKNRQKDKYLFNTFEEASEYLNWWLGNWGPVDIDINEKYDYNGYGDIVEIKKLE